MNDSLFVKEDNFFYLSHQSFEKRTLWELVSLLTFAFSKKNCPNLVITTSSEEPHLPTINWNDVDYKEINDYARAYEEFPDDLFEKIYWNSESRDSVYREVFGKNEPLVSHTTEQLEDIIYQTVDTVIKAFNNIGFTLEDDTLLYSDFQNQLHKLHKPAERNDLKANISFINLDEFGEICIANTLNLSLETLSQACSEHQKTIKGFICYGERDVVISDKLYPLLIDPTNLSGFDKVNYGYKIAYDDLPSSIISLINQA